MHATYASNKSIGIGSIFETDNAPLANEFHQLVANSVLFSNQVLGTKKIFANAVKALVLTARTLLQNVLHATGDNIHSLSSVKL